MTNLKKAQPLSSSETRSAKLKARNLIHKAVAKIAPNPVLFKSSTFTSTNRYAWHINTFQSRMYTCTKDIEFHIIAHSTHGQTVTEAMEIIRRGLEEAGLSVRELKNPYPNFPNYELIAKVPVEMVLSEELLTWINFYNQEVN